MNSRYNFMSPSKVTDIDSEQFPDPLCVQYNNLYPTYELVSHQITSTDLEKFFNMMQREYGKQEFDDMLLSYNGVPYIGYLEPGNEIYLLKFEDLSNYS